MSHSVLPELISLTTHSLQRWSRLWSWWNGWVRCWLPTRELRRVAICGLAAILIASLMVPILGVLLPSRAQAGWHNEDWQYRQSQLLTHASAEDNVYVNFSGPDAIDTSITGRFQADCGDLRFVDARGNELPYYVVSGCGTSATVVHALFSTLPAGEQYIYIYYGNPSVGNGTTGFDFATAATGVTFGSRGSEESSAGTVAEWKFDEGYGTTTKNGSSGQYTGTLTSGPAWQPQENCVRGKCLKFDGVDDNVTISNAAPLQIVSDITIEAWVFPINNTLYQPIVSKDSSNEYEIAADFRSGADLATRWEGVQKNFSGFFDGYTNQWVHVAVTVSGSTISAYRNGALVGTTAGVSRTTSTNNVTIGKRTGGNYWFKGLVDEVKIYDYAITLSQLQWQYVADSQQLIKQGGNLQNGLIGHWKMDEASWSGVAGEVKDSSLAGRDLTSYNSAATKAGKYGYGADLSATTSYIGGINTTIQATNAPRGYSFWIKPNSAQNWAYVWSLYITNNLGNIMYYGTGGGLHARICENNSQLSVTPVIGQWNHVVFTFDPVSMTEVSYLNGVKKETIDLSGVGCEAFPTAKSMYIGGYSTGASKFDGDMDEFREYSRALSYQDAQQLYSLGPSPLAQYDFEEASGSTFYDSSTNGLHGTSGDTPRVMGKYGRGINITPGTNIVYSPTNMPPLNITMNGWIKLNAFGGNVAGYDGGAYVLGTTGDYKIYARVSDGVTFPNLSSSVVFSSADIGKWHHIAMSFDGSTVKFYLNGRYVSQSSTSLVPNRVVKRICIGYCGNGYANGDVDSVRFYNYVRTPQQIVEDMNGGRSNLASPTSWWKLDENSGTTANDSGLLNIAGTLNGSTWDSGGSQGALSFDGVDDYVTIADNDSYSIDLSNQFTASIWIKPSSLTGWKEPLSKGQSGAYEWSFRLEDNRPKFYLYTSSGTNFLSASSAAIMTSGQWTNLTATVDLSLPSVKIYVNGALQGSSTVASGTYTNSTAPVRMGIRGDGSNKYSGLIDDIKIWNTALTSQQVLAEANRADGLRAGSSGSEVVTTGSGGTGTMPGNSKDSQYCVPGDTSACAAPVGEWGFEEGSGATVKDASGNGNDGSMNGGTEWGLGKYGGAGSFDGVDDFVDMGNNSVLSPSTLTVSAWIKPTATDGSRYVVAKNAGSSTTKDYTLMISSGVARFAIFNGNTGYGVSGTTSISTNQWHFLTGSWDGTTAKIFLDGRLEGTLVPGVSKSSTSQRLMIGKTDSWGGPFAGQIDNVRLYDYARSAAQVAWDYNQGGPIAWYKMNECQGGVLHSSTEPYNAAFDATINLGASGQTAIGTCLSSGTAWGNGANGKSGGSLYFDGANDMASIPGIPNNFFANSYTIAAWIKRADDRAQHTIIGTSNGDPPVNLGTRGGGGALNFEGNDSANNLVFQIRTGSLPKNEWHHVVAIFNKETATATIYRDNKYVGSAPVTGTPKNASNDVRLGRDYWNGTMLGQLDDVQIFNYALTPRQIASVYNGGSVKWGP